MAQFPARIRPSFMQGQQLSAPATVPRRMRNILLIAFALIASATLRAAEPRKVELTVEGLARTALIFAPPKSNQPAPLVFGWHGHGGSALNAARSFRIHELWPEAVVIYADGVRTAGRTDPEGTKRGWQQKSDDLGGRDLKFFDALLAFAQKEYSIDPKRIYSTGHSNGSAFTYVLWGARPDVFAAIGSSAGGFRPLYAGKPIPALHIAGEKDEIVPFRGQSFCMAAMRRINGCSADAKPWGDTKGALLYPSEKGTPFVSYIHGGGHVYPPEASGIIVRFFKEHKK